MINDIVERQVEAAVNDALGERAVKVMKGIGNMAAKQGGESALANYKLLGKRALITVGVVIVVANIATWAVGSVVSRKLEDKRIEQTVRRVLAEERERERAYVEAKA